MGIAAQNDSILIEVLHGQTKKASALTVSIGAFYIAQACWTVIYDTVYAQQDVEDDAKAGVRSIAIRFRGQAKTLLWSLSVVKVFLLVVSGYAAGFGVGHMAVACGGVLASFVYMLVTIKLQVPADCAWWFKNGCWFVAASVVGGFCLELKFGVQW
jgi:4-hydroxybenzoate polyprenyltransferase